MALIFDPSTGLKAPDTSEIRQSVVADWSAAFTEEGQPLLDTDPTSPAGQLIDAQTAEIEAKNADTLFLANQFNPKVAEGRWQDALGFIYFLTRKKNEPTVVVCQLTGLNGTVIPYGALVRNDDGHTLMCNKAVTIVDGTAETTFRSSVTGPIPIPAGSVNTIVTTTPGWDSIANQEAGVTGRDLETRSDYEARRYASVAANAHGSVASIYGSLHNLSGYNGVLDVQVLENVGPLPVIKYGVEVPGHGLTVCIFGGTDEEIARIIYEKKDAGCDTGGNTDITHQAADHSGAIYHYKIMRPETINFWVKIRLASAASATPAVVEAIKEAVYRDFLGENSHTGQPRLGLAQSVFASRFYHAVTALDMVRDLLEVTVALSDAPEDVDYVDHLDIRGDQEPVMTKDNITVIGG